MTQADAVAVSELADQLVGQGYYSPNAVVEMLSRSTLKGRVCSHVAISEATTLVGFRFALPPGRWTHGRGEGLSEELWPVPKVDCGYFQTAYVADNWRGKGIGSAMAKAALESLVEMGAQAVITHSWKESPNNSSFRYLSRLGFETVAEHIDYWLHVDYDCVLDGRPCRCTAIEMCLVLNS